MKGWKVIRNHQRSFSKVTAHSMVEKLAVWTRESSEAVYLDFSKAFNAVSPRDMSGQTGKREWMGGLAVWVEKVEGLSGSEGR